MPDALDRDRAAVPDAFDRVAGRYDLLTGLNPGYRKHLRWSARRLGLGPDARVLDLCCGTGLSTEAVAAECPGASIVAVDASPGMLAVARSKPLAATVQFLLGDAMEPEVSGLAGPFDGILMAYGLRNVPDPDRCLARLYRLLRPGGTICLHEYSVADSSRSRLVWNAVTLGVIIPGGLLFSGSTRIYRYLRRSVNAFDGVRALERRLARAGFVDVRTEPMDGWQRGIVHSFLGRRPG
ncbi:MAG: class I SAM-dependent methyltransferase [Gemmatimonadota bacterium]|nr:class I SAM-dependent methyltransferase [Gemmatimonadota bacterium]